MKTKNPIKQVDFSAASIKSRPISSTVKNTNYGTADWSAAGEAIADIGASVAAGINAREQQKQELDCEGKDKADPACDALNKTAERKAAKEKAAKEKAGKDLNTDTAGGNGTKKIVSIKDAALDKIDSQDKDYDFIKGPQPTRAPFAIPTLMKVNPVMQKMGIKKGGFKLRSR